MVIVEGLASRFSSWFCRAVFLVATGLLISQPAGARPLDPITADQLDQQVKELQHITWSGKALEKQDGWSGACRRSIVTLEVGDPTTGLTHPMPFTVLRPDTTKQVPMMIVVPTIAGVTVIENSVAAQFCDYGLASVIADVNDVSLPSVLPSWGIENERDRNAILALRTVIDYVAATPAFDPKRIGMIGLSLGAVTTSMMAGVEQDRLQAIITVVGGGNLPHVLSLSQADVVAEVRDKRMEHEGMTTADEYEEALHKSMTYDPLRLAVNAKRERIMMIMSDADDKVPTPQQYDLFNAWNKPKNAVFAVGHEATIIALTYFYFDYVTDFLDYRFGLNVRARHKPVARPASVPAPYSLPTR